MDQVDYKELKRSYRTELLTGGLVLGLVLVALMFLQYGVKDWGKEGFGGIVQTLLGAGDFVAMVTVLVVYGRRVGRMYEKAPMGFSYGRAFGFSILLLMLAGIIYGAGYYILSEAINPAYFGEMKDGIIEGTMQVYIKMEQFTPEQLEMSRKALNFMMHNLLGIVIVYVMTIAFQGGFIALFTSAIVRRKPIAAQQVQ